MLITASVPQTSLQRQLRPLAHQFQEQLRALGFLLQHHQNVLLAEIAHGLVLRRKREARCATKISQRDLIGRDDAKLSTKRIALYFPLLSKCEVSSIRI